MLLSSEEVDPASLMLLAKAVMPNGNSAFLQKADVPTYLVGSDSDLKAFSRLVPAPNETYTTLLWLGDTSPVDQYFMNRKQEEAKTKTLGRGKMASALQSTPLSNKRSPVAGDAL